MKKIIISIILLCASLCAIAGPSIPALQGGPIAATTVTASGQVSSNGKNVLSVLDTKAGQTPVAITVGASPFAYTATYGGCVDISGGAVTAMARSRSGTTTWNSTLSSGSIPVRAGDIITVTYTTAPTMYQLSN